jgi:hypothetical protein
VEFLTAGSESLAPIDTVRDRHDQARGHKAGDMEFERDGIAFFHLAATISKRAMFLNARAPRRPYLSAVASRSVSPRSGRASEHVARAKVFVEDVQMTHTVEQRDDRGPLAYRRRERLDRIVEVVAMSSERIDDVNIAKALLTLAGVSSQLLHTGCEYCGLNFLERTHFYLANALAGYSIFDSKRLKIRGLVAQLACREDMSFTRIERFKGGLQSVPALCGLIFFS